MLESPAADAGGIEEVRKPRAMFDVCPSPPLNWSRFAAQNLISWRELAFRRKLFRCRWRERLLRSRWRETIVQHAAEVWRDYDSSIGGGGGPLGLGRRSCDFRYEQREHADGRDRNAMLNAGCAQVGKSLKMPTHGYLVASDSRSLDAQAGMESGASAVLGALAGINMISGAGMLHSLSCHSVEKLVLDAESIASAQRLVEGIQPRGEIRDRDFRAGGLDR